MSSNLTKVAEISKPHGVRGLVQLKLFIDLEYFLSLEQFYLDNSLPIEVLYKFSKKNHPIFQISGINSRTDAEKQSKKSILAPCNPRETCEPDEFLYSDLIGSTVLLKDQTIGSVKTLYNAGAHEIIVIQEDSANKLFDVPFTAVHFPVINVHEKSIVLSEDAYSLFSTLND
ncbi:MAG: 16S rRNA processing protein RimM [Alphaproteobacteria bacterium]|nr:MAG: 16S rRNA processing protein RimM [Alphaproteobacteria bacterium]